MIIGLDFDGTVCKHRYPEIGEPVPRAIYWLGRLQDAGAQFVLWTCRGGETLTPAVNYLRLNGIRLVGENKHPVHKQESPKIFADLYIDDRAVGCPLTYQQGERPYVDWERVGPEILFALSEQARSAT